jgi:gas vesicle protein
MNIETSDMSINTYDYHIYNIVCKNPEIKHNYVGSTRAWKMRNLCHKQRTNDRNGKCYNLPLYKCIRQFGGWNNWQMVLLENIHCTKREAEAIERRWIEEKKSDLNSSTRPFITEQERGIQNKIYNKKYREDNKDYIAELQKEYREKNSENIKLYKKEYYQEKKDTIKEKSNNYYQENKDHVLKRTKQYYQENKEKIAQYNKEWREKNKEKSKAYREEHKEKYQAYQKDYNKEYREKNKARLFEKITCECGAVHIFRNTAQHKKTKRHQKYLDSLIS